MSYKKVNNETHESRKQLNEELREFKKITESLINGAEKLRLIEKDTVKDLKKGMYVNLLKTFAN